MLRLAIATLVFSTAVVGGVAHAQEPDTLAAPDRPAPRPALDTTVAFFRYDRGEVLTGPLPERSPALHPAEWIAGITNSFLYSFRTPGWPEGWSPYGLSPNEVLFRRGGYDYVNLTTGRSTLEMLPFGLMEPLRLQAGSDGRAVVLGGDIRTFDQARPLTGIRYQSDNNGLQHVEAFHAQRRRATILGREGVLNLSFAYMGRGADGEYPGSRLSRERSVHGRIRFARPGWSLQLSNLHGRHDVGAHGGVVPQIPGAYQTIFVRTGAGVRLDGARRVTIRNDLDATFRAHLLRLPLTLIGYRTSESFRYNRGTITLPVRIHRTGATAFQSVDLPGQRLQMRIHGWFETVEDDSAFVVADAPRRFASEGMIRDSLRLGPLNLELEGRIRHTHHGTRPGVLARADVATGWLRPFVEFRSDPIDRPRIADQGFGGFVVPTTISDMGRTHLARLGAEVSFGNLDLRLEAFASREERKLSFMPGASRDTIRATILDEPVDMTGASARLGFRVNAERGIYGQTTFSYVMWQTEPAVAGAAPLSQTLPELHGDARIGARMLLFRGDLDADLSVRGRYWTGMNGRVLHAPTGLLVVADAGARWFEPSGLLDVVLEADVRTATIFLAYENVLSGTTITPGNLIVPDYPLPERRFRLGVYWPIQD